MTNKENLEIKVHDGPARLGKLDDLKTPSIIEANSMKLCPDEPMAYNVPLSLAEWSVEQTLEKASEYRDSEKCSIDTFAVIHGAKYTDLRVECAKKLDKMGYNRLLISNADELIRRPRDLADIISSILKKDMFCGEEQANDSTKLRNVPFFIFSLTSRTIKSMVFLLYSKSSF